MDLNVTVKQISHAQEIEVKLLQNTNGNIMFQNKNQLSELPLSVTTFQQFIIVNEGFQPKIQTHFQPNNEFALI